MMAMLTMQRSSSAVDYSLMLLDPVAAASADAMSGKRLDAADAVARHVSISGRRQQVAVEHITADCRQAASTSGHVTPTVVAGC